LVAALENAVPELLDAVDHSDDPAVLSGVCILAGEALLRHLARGVALGHGLVLERAELTEAATAAGEQGDQEKDERPYEAEAAGARGQAAAAEAATAEVSYLIRIELGVAAKAHVGAILPTPVLRRLQRSRSVAARRRAW
jgi:hypothetical protein